MAGEGKKDSPSMTSDWRRVMNFIDGVQIKQTRHIITGSSITTELFRTDWPELQHSAQHIMQVVMHPEAISAWHHHKKQTDGFFVNMGLVRLVMYDDRNQSPTRGLVNEFRLGHIDPCLVVVPPGVWHGLQNLQSAASGFLNITDHPYQYDDPDEWRLPADTDVIPYQFK